MSHMFFDDITGHPIKEKQEVFSLEISGYMDEKKIPIELKPYMKEIDYFMFGGETNEYDKKRVHLRLETSMQTILKLLFLFSRIKKESEKIIKSFDSAFHNKKNEVSNE